MAEMAVGTSRNDDPRKLREMLEKAAGLASHHSLHSVMVGMAGDEGDLIFPELVDFFESALRVDDAIFRMTRERAVLMLADADRGRAEEIVDRLLNGFRERFSAVEDVQVNLGYFEVVPDSKPLSIKHVLPTIFSPPSAH